MGTRSLILTGVIAATILWVVDSADARIICRGAYQIVQGQPIATPYCEDAYLAEVAQEYGMRVTASAIRSSPATKQRVCRVIGHDNRARSACAQYRDDGFLRRRF